MNAAVRKSDRKQVVIKVVRLSGLSKRVRSGRVVLLPAALYTRWDDLTRHSGPRKRMRPSTKCDSSRPSALRCASPRRGAQAAHMAATPCAPAGLLPVPFSRC